MSDPAVTAPIAPQLGARLCRALVLISVAQLMLVLDGTITNIALPHIARDVGMSAAALTWVVTIYALAFGGLLLLGGRLGDLLGRRRTFAIGWPSRSPRCSAAPRPSRGCCSAPARCRAWAPPSPRPRSWR